MKKLARLVASLILAGAMAAPAFAGFEFHGYGRAGVIMNSDGKQATHHIEGPAGADNGIFNYNWGHKPFTHSIGRLGNERDNYMEAALVNTFGAGKVNGKTVIRFAYKDHYTAAWWGKENAAPSNDTVNGSVGVRELYSEMTGLSFAPKATVWAGKRFYGREDAHINDFYFRIMDGTGAGVTMPIGPGEFSGAFIATGDNRASLATSADDNGKLIQKNFDLRYDMPALDGKVKLEANIISLADASGTDLAEDGLGLYAGYERADFFGMKGGFSKVFVQYGTAAGADLGSSAGWYMCEDAKALRLGALGVAEVGDNLKMMATAFYEQADSKYAKTGSDQQWYAITVRPEYAINRNFALVGEFGYENMAKQNSDSKDDAGMYKLTVAPTITLDNSSFWSRPQLRAFVTYAGWGDDIKGGWAAGGPQYKDDNNGMTYGVQMEAWW